MPNRCLLCGAEGARHAHNYMPTREFIEKNQLKRNVGRVNFLLCSLCHKSANRDSAVIYRLGWCLRPYRGFPCADGQNRRQLVELMEGTQHERDD